MQKYTQNYLQRRRAAVVLGVLHGALRLRDPAADPAAQHRVLAAQSGQRRAVQRVQRHPVPQRDDLFQSRRCRNALTSCSTTAWGRSASSGSARASPCGSCRRNTCTSRSSPTKSSIGASHDAPGAGRRRDLAGRAERAHHAARDAAGQVPGADRHRPAPHGQPRRRRSGEAAPGPYPAHRRSRRKTRCRSKRAASISRPPTTT